MNVTVETVELSTQRALLYLPVHPRERFPGVIAWSDIFQQTGPHRRLCHRLAGHGYVVLSPELYGRFEPRGTALDFERDRQRALDDADRLTLPEVDQDLDEAHRFLAAHPRVASVSTCGFCLGGHLAFRLALREGIAAAACFYATGLHSRTLGSEKGTARTLDEAGRIAGELLLVWGTRDPHIPAEGRHEIHQALARAGKDVQVRLFDAEHTFMRDEGARYDGAAADAAFADLTALLRSVQA